jgi:hypothetical protein
MCRNSAECRAFSLSPALKNTVFYSDLLSYYKKNFSSWYLLSEKKAEKQIMLERFNLTL